MNFLIVIYDKIYAKHFASNPFFFLRVYTNYRIKMVHLGSSLHLQLNPILSVQTMR